MSYSLNGSTVTIHVDHQATGVAYPVIADTDAEHWTIAELNRARRLLWDMRRSSSMLTTLDGPGDVYDSFERLTRAERAFCLGGDVFGSNTRLCYEFEKDRTLAVDMQEAWFTAAPPDSRADAFRHTVWVALMTITAGNRGREEEGLRQGQRHEERDPDRDASGSDRIAFFRSQRMDLRNNLIGHNFVLAYHSANGRWPSNTFACRQALIRSRTAWLWIDALGWPVSSSPMVFFRRGSKYAENRSQCLQWE